MARYVKPNRASRFTVDSMLDPDLIALRKAVKIHNYVAYAFGEGRDPQFKRVVVMPRGGKRRPGSATTLVKGAKSYDVYVYRMYMSREKFAFGCLRHPSTVKPSELA